MRVLVACEFSGTVRDAFRVLRHEAWSCDLLGPGDMPDEFRSQLYPNYHLKGDVLQFLGDKWDLMIAHPPCTHLAVSGARYFKNKQREQIQALDFVRALLNAPIPKIALENPVSVISSHIRKPDQIIQPWQFGHPESKTTCLWLKNLPKLQPTNILTKTGKYWNNQTPSGQNKLGPSPNRWALRSKTYPGIAFAMANQWGNLNA